MRQDEESDKGVYGRSGASSKGGVSCVVLRVVKHSTVRWYGRLGRMDESDNKDIRLD